MGLGAGVCTGIVCVIDKKVIDFLFIDEVKGKYIKSRESLFRVAKKVVKEFD